MKRKLLYFDTLFFYGSVASNYCYYYYYLVIAFKKRFSKVRLRMKFPCIRSSAAVDGYAFSELSFSTSCVTFELQLRL